MSRNYIRAVGYTRDKSVDGWSQSTGKRTMARELGVWFFEDTDPVDTERAVARAHTAALMCADKKTRLAFYRVPYALGSAYPEMGSVLPCEGGSHQYEPWRAGMLCRRCGVVEKAG
jgi:hypothetical protein